MHRYRLLAVLVLGLCLLSCDNDSTGPDPSLYGSWVRDITDSAGVTFTAELKINTDNSYDFILLTQAPGHTNSSAQFTLSGRRMSITVDADCSGVGVYQYVVSTDALALVGIEDPCGPRQAALEGVWDKK